jgi:hypothetical protein
VTIHMEMKEKSTKPKPYKQTNKKETKIKLRCQKHLEVLVECSNSLILR